MESGVVAQWLLDEEGKNKGFGFIERSSGERLFCHKSKIVDGDALFVGSEVKFDASEDERKPNSLKAANVAGGVCFAFVYLKECRRPKCKLMHAVPPVAARPGPSVDEAAAAVAASRGEGPAPILVDTIEACTMHCDRLAKSGVIAVDFEGVDLGRHGELLLAQLVEADGQVVLVDIGKLGRAAFDEGLRELLESEAVTKLIYDARSDADALLHLFECRLVHACDCQVLYTLHADTERQRKGEPKLEKLPGLAAALSNCPALSESGDGNALAQLKKAVRPLFIPEMGGSYEVWRERPLRNALIEYAAADVSHLHKLYAEWRHLISDEEVTRISALRIEKATCGEERRKGPHMAKRDF